MELRDRASEQGGATELMAWVPPGLALLLVIWKWLHRDMICVFDVVTVVGSTEMGMSSRWVSCLS